LSLTSSGTLDTTPLERWQLHNIVEACDNPQAQALFATTVVIVVTLSCTTTHNTTHNTHTPQQTKFKFSDGDEDYTALKTVLRQ
jgi:hypothetical protein